MIRDIVGDDKLGISNSVGIGVGGGDVGIIGLGVRLELIAVLDSVLMTVIKSVLITVASRC